MKECVSRPPKSESRPLLWSLAALVAMALWISASSIPALAGPYQTPKPASAARELKTLSGHLHRAVLALKQHEISRARHSYRGFDRGWEQIEDGIRAKSRTSYRRIERAMGRVRSTLVEPKRPDRGKARTALAALQKTIDRALPGLR